MPQCDYRVNLRGPDRWVDAGQKADKDGKSDRPQTKPPWKTEVIHVRHALPVCKAVNNEIDNAAHTPS